MESAIDHFPRLTSLTNYRDTTTITYLLAPDVPVSNPLAELRPPVLQHVRLRVFDALAVAEASLGAGGGDHVDRVKIDFQPLARFRRDLLLRAPGTSVALLPQPARVNIYTEITGLFYLFFVPFPLFFFLFCPISPFLSRASFPRK
ncbi:hypothetical protein WN51_00103 [Melipona quadrifasciata]|uniref:Uncharacterized protein n=1 Tax=Melipona quadrifasciata TaxID=166423 RepID=A0A0M9ACR1_9HYME|nr:hypothetical protein WN51_00103 [Melipona quadrifasciata]